MVNRVFLNTVSADPVNRDVNDFYPTHERGTNALLGAETFKGRTWEPACGDGRMTAALAAGGVNVVASSDLHDYGYGTTGMDFLSPSTDFRSVGGRTRKVANVVTNPPFVSAEAFALKALSVTTDKVALLGRLSWLEGKGRYRTVFSKTPLARVHVFTWRLPFRRGGTWLDAKGREPTGGTVAFAWYVWEHGHVGPPTLNWLE